MGKKKDLTDMKFERLTVLYEAHLIIQVAVIEKLCGIVDVIAGKN